MALGCCLIGLILGAAPQDTKGLTDIQLLDMAERAFSRGVLVREFPREARPNFQAAADCYTTLYERGVQNAEFHRNQGNAYLLAGDVSRAILAYRRGLRLAPDDRLLQANLTYAREQVIYPGNANLLIGDGTNANQEIGVPREPRPPWLPWIAPVWRLLLDLGFYSLACLALARWWMARNGHWLGAAAGAALVAILLAFSLAADEYAKQRGARYPLAVVAEDGVLLRKGNGLAYPPRYQTALNRGVEARVLFERRGWFQLELAGGEVGWVPAKSILLDAPP